jgi:hypothetical protein
MGRNNNPEFLELLRHRIESLKAEIQDLENRKGELDSQANRIRQRLKRTEDYYRNECQEEGVTLPLEKLDLMGKGAREACELLLQHNEKMTKDQLVNALVSHGFDFKGKSPGRVIFWALVSNPSIRMSEDNAFEYAKEGVMGTQASMQRSRPSLRQGVIQFFVQKQNAPASLEQILEELKRLGTTTMSGNLKDALSGVLNLDDFERIDEGYRLKPRIFQKRKKS